MNTFCSFCVAESGERLTAVPDFEKEVGVGLDSFGYLVVFAAECLAGIFHTHVFIKDVNLCDFVPQS